ncbi:MAG: hypothetical protein K2M89_04415 [Clostridiales bacterium]|nr:hypothetical protein [Clostridiales bacterium]
MKKLRRILCAFFALFLCVALLPVGQGYVYAETEQSVYIGGYPIGISIDIDGLLVESVTGVETEYGIAAVEGLRKGDIIKKIDGKEVDDVDDISEIITTADAVKIDLSRNGKDISLEVKPMIEAFSQKPRLGIKIKDVIYGVGTVTFVREDGSYAALGHEISYDGGSIPFDGGHIHACKVVGVKKGGKGEAGALLASVSPDKVYGSVCCNNSFGIAGQFHSDFAKGEKVPLAKRGEVHAGAAKIKTSVNGESQYYDIEIIKASHQSSRKEKGMVIRITDKRLLDLTGGVVRGMSGSPILQDGKLVGAVTHVFLNDFTKGYGVYAEFMN